MEPVSLTLAAHPRLEVAAFETHLSGPLEQLLSPPALQAMLGYGVDVPMRSSDAVRAAVRDVLRFGGFKPTGRSKPASEYLLKALEEGMLSSINAAVDACNVVSLHSGLPISVVDLERTRGPLKILLAPSGSSYIFNASEQRIDLSGLLCLWDEEGPCANAVRDSQRTKTHSGTTRTLSVIWGAKTLPGRAQEAARWYQQLLEGLGCVCRPVVLREEP
ncbi:MAG: phenylalanine--tRNA ligase beta subunit-related protein [Myxococcota bacterium]